MLNTKRSLYFKLLCAFALITAIAVTLPVLFWRNILHLDKIDLAKQEALARASFAGVVLESSPAEEQVREIFASASKLGFRLTLTGADGAVIRDSHVAVNSIPALDNHGDRPEIEEALAKGTGISIRHGNTLDMDAVYAAVLLRGGEILRVAIPLAGIRHHVERQLPLLFGIGGSVGLLCLLLSAFVAGRVRKHMDAMAEVVAVIARETTGGETRRRLRDVRWREMRPLAHAVNYMADTIDAYIATITDQQRQLETILDSMHEGVLVLGPTGAVRRWNKALAGLFPDIERAEGKPLIEVLPFPALQNMVDELLACTKSGAEAGAEGGKNSAPAKKSLHCELPEGRFLVAHASPPAERNDSLGAVIVVYDATDIMRLERVRKDFVSNVSHELRTPLTAIAGYAETLMTLDDATEEQKRFAVIIHKHAASLGKIISDLLALARLENARETVDLVPVDARTPLADAMASVREQAKANGVEIRADLEDVPVLANASLLAQVFRNLLENACRYSPRNGVVRVTSRKAGEKVLFAVTDCGPGIPREALPRIFERFYQVKRERNTGTAGIGLAICKHIIERHNGRIWAEAPGEGTGAAMLFTLSAAMRAPKEP